MKWLYELTGIPQDHALRLAIPKEKLLGNIRTKFIQSAVKREIEYIDDIVYHAIFRSEPALSYHGELHIIEVKLRDPKYVKSIAEAFDQAIPYWKIIIFSSGDKYLLFESHSDGNRIMQYQFSDWVYEEELLIDFSFGISRHPESVIDPDNQEEWSQLPELLSNLFRASSNSDYLSLRHLMDFLRIRELQYDKVLVRPVIFKAIEYGKIEYYDGMPFITWTDAHSLYRASFPRNYLGGIGDGRFGIDRQFDSLSRDDFHSSDDVLRLLEEGECAFLYHSYDPARYDFESDEFNNDSERYGDDENYDYVERYDYYN